MAGFRQRRDRTEALAKERIVTAAIELLDSGGEDGLTFRALANRLATGSGAIYWHVAGKAELLAAATEDVIGRALPATSDPGNPRTTIRTIALAVFDIIDQHPWVGAQLAHEPQQVAALRIYEAIGRALTAFNVPERARFDAWSALVSYVLGAAGQNAANARRFPPETARGSYLAAVSDLWSQLEPSEYPFMRALAPHLNDHDDRTQFLAGIDLLLVGIDAVRKSADLPNMISH